MLSSGTFWKVAAGAGVLMVGYCIYFDRKRRSDPLFKQKLRERRKKAQEIQQSRIEHPILNKPTASDPESYQRFFLQEVQLGEELLAKGDVQNGVEHLANALAVCSQPRQLMLILQQSLPPAICHLLTTQLPVATKRIFGPEPELADPINRAIMMSDDDLE